MNDAVVNQSWDDITEMFKETVPPWERRNLEWVRHKVRPKLQELFDMAYQEGWAARSEES